MMIALKTFIQNNNKIYYSLFSLVFIFTTIKSQGNSIPIYPKKDKITHSLSFRMGHNTNDAFFKNDKKCTASTMCSPSNAVAEKLEKYTFETTDHLIVVKNNTVIFDYLSTDDNPLSPVQLRVIEKPNYGTVRLNEDQTFEYTPFQHLCEKNDLFVYQITCGTQVTNVKVSIDILCEDLTVFNGISTDENAGKLENFTILGVENYPENTLYVFDDAGTEVFQTKGYTNDWNGTLATNNILDESRMYYYVFSDGGGNYYSGYLQIN